MFCDKFKPLDFYVFISRLLSLQNSNEDVSELGQQLARQANKAVSIYNDGRLYIQLKLTKTVSAQFSVSFLGVYASITMTFVL